MTVHLASIDEFQLGLMTMAPLLLIVLAGWYARRWWVRQRTD